MAEPTTEKPVHEYLPESLLRYPPEPSPPHENNSETEEMEEMEEQIHLSNVIRTFEQYAPFAVCLFQIHFFLGDIEI